jgi:type IV secretion system protein TrbJ
MANSLYGLFIFALVSFLGLPLNAYGVAALVFDPTVCARLASEAAQLKQQVDLLEEQLNAIKQLNPNQYKWGNAQQLINQLGSVIEQSKGLSYSARNLDSIFKQSFPGYTPPQDFDAQYQKITRSTLDTLNGVMHALGKSAEDFQTENARLSFLQTQAKSAVGQTQAIQVAAQIASEQVSQLQLLRQTLMAQTTAESSYFASQIQNEASSQAELKQIIKAGKINAPAIGHSGHAIEVATITVGS